MNKHLFILLIAVCPVMVQAQADGWLNKINNKIKSKATARADKKIDQAIDGTLDKIEGKNQPVKKNEPTPQKPGDTSIAGKKLYVKYDFVPGEQIIYSNDLATDNM